MEREFRGRSRVVSTRCGPEVRNIRQTTKMSILDRLRSSTLRLRPEGSGTLRLRPWNKCADLNSISKPCGHGCVLRDRSSRSLSSSGIQRRFRRKRLQMPAGQLIIRIERKNVLKASAGLGHLACLREDRAGVKEDDGEPRARFDCDAAELQCFLKS